MSTRPTDESIKDIANPLAYVIANDPESLGKAEKAMVADARKKRLELLNSVIKNPNDQEAMLALKKLTQAMVSALFDRLPERTLEEQRQAVHRMLISLDGAPAGESEGSALNMDAVALYEAIFSDDPKFKHAQALRSLPETIALFSYISSEKNPPGERVR